MSISLNHTLDKVSTNSGILSSGDTGGFVLPSGDNTAQKPSVVGNTGLIRYNTSSNKIEAVINGVYVNLATTSDITGFVSKTGDTMTGVLALPSGSISTPSLTFSGNTTCGLFNPSSNNVAVSTNSLERMRVDNLGNVLVGTTTVPSGSNTVGLMVAPTNSLGVHSLYVKGYDSGITINGYLAQLNLTDGSLVGVMKSTGSGGNLQVGTTSSSPVVFLTNNTERMRLAASGGLAIGTTSVSSGTILDMSGASSSMLVPIGATGSRPTGINGMIRYNSDLNQFEGYANNAWGSIGGGSNFLTQSFSSPSDFTPGTTTQLTLTVTPSPITKAALFIFMDGVFQNYSTWNLTGTVITFDSVIPLGVKTVQVMWVIGLATPVLTFNQGNEASPGLAVLGNPSTGFFQDSINTLGLSTNGVSALFIDSNGNIGIGTKTPISGGLTGSLRITKESVGVSAHAIIESNTNAQCSIRSFQNTATAPEVSSWKARGTIATPTAVQNNDVIMLNQGYAYDGSAWQSPASMEYGVSGTVASNIVPTYIKFTNTTATGLKREVARFNPDGTLTAPYAFANSLTQNGYQKLPGGLIIQWARISITVSPTAYTFPISFPSACFVVNVGSGENNTTAGAEVMNITPSSITASGFSASASYAATYTYIAIGY